MAPADAGVRRAIPTRVGRTTKYGGEVLVLVGPSPRVWGELRPFTRFCARSNGPSPRVWGEHLVNTGVLPIN